MIESGDGGDLVFNGTDLVVINGFQNMPYIGMFGGNVDQSTTGPKLPDEQAFDWWGNDLFMPAKPKIQINSNLERTLKNTALNSSGRIQIEQAVKKDLDFMKDFAIVSVIASIKGPDRLQIDIKIQEPNNLQTTEQTFIWDSTNQELSAA